MNTIKSFAVPFLVLATWAALAIAVLSGFQRPVTHRRVEETIVVVAPRRAS